MRLCTLVAVAGLSVLLLAVPAGAQGGGRQRYQIDPESKRIRGPYQREGSGKLLYDVSFQIKATGQDVPVEEARDTVVIKENGREAHRFELRQARARDLTTVLALDVSGSTKTRGKG